MTVTTGVTGVIADSVSCLAGAGGLAGVIQLAGRFGNGAGNSGSSTISGTTSSTLTIANPQYPLDQATYSLIASNSAGLATNATVLTT